MAFGIGGSSFGLRSGASRETLSRLFPFTPPPSNLCLSSALYRRKSPEDDKDDTSAAVNGLALKCRKPELNMKGARIIFTTHVTSLLARKLLRGDQIWFTEKLEDQSSALIPLTEFSSREGRSNRMGLSQTG
jgi:hypothetical protein